MLNKSHYYFLTLLCQTFSTTSDLNNSDHHDFNDICSIFFVILLYSYGCLKTLDVILSTFHTINTLFTFYLDMSYIYIYIYIFVSTSNLTFMLIIANTLLVLSKNLDKLWNSFDGRCQR